MKTKRLKFMKAHVKSMTTEAKRAKALADRVCKWLSSVTGQLYKAEIDNLNGDYEADILVFGVSEDDARCRKPHERWYLAFWGGHFKKFKHSRQNESAAWVSLAEDIIGVGECGDDHKLSKYFESENPEVRAIDSSSLDELDLKLTAWGF